MDRLDAIDYVNSNAPWSNRSGTNYDLALSTAMTSYASARALPEGDQTFVYFLSDGEPVNGAIDGDSSGANVSISDWEGHVTTNGIDQVFALGIGAAPVSALNPVAYPKVDPPGAPVQYENVILVSTANVGDLGDTFQELLGATSSISGNILLDDPSTTFGADGFGADGGYIRSITINGVTYTFDGTNTVSESGGTPAGYSDHGTWIEVPTTLGGKLTFYFAATGAHNAGEWGYLTPANIGATATETFQYRLIDGDGDLSPLTDLAITVQNVNVAPVVSSLNGDAATFLAATGVPVLLDQGGNATVTDIDSANFDTGTLTVAITANGVPSEDVVLIGNIGLITVGAGTVSFSGTQIGTFTGGTGGANLVVTLDPDATPTAVQALVHALQYDNTNGANPDLDPRTITVSVTDSDGATSNISTVTVNVDDNLAPVAGDDIVITNIVDGSAIVVPHTAVLANDTDANSDPLSVTGTSGASGGTATNGAGIVTFTPNVDVQVSQYRFTNVTAATAAAGGHRAGQFETDDGDDDALLSLGAPTGFTANLTDADYNAIESSNDTRFQTPDPGDGDNAVFWAEFDIAEDPDAITQLVIRVEARQSGSPSGSEGIDIGIYNYADGAWEIVTEVLTTSDNVFTVTKLGANAADYVSSSGKISVALYNEDDDNDDQRIQVDNVELDVTHEQPFATGSFNYTASDGTGTDVGHVDIIGQNGSTLTGTSASEIFIAGSGNDIIVGQQNDTLFDGGSGNDTLELAGNFTSTSNGQVVNIDNVTLTAAATLNLSNQTEGFTITGSSGADSITGGSAADVVVGAGGADILEGGAGNDIYSYASTAEAAVGENIVEAAGGGTDTIRTTATADLSALKVNSAADLSGASSLGIEQIVIQGGTTATFSGAQLNGNTIAVNESAAGTTGLVINVASGTTADLSDLTFAASSGDAFDNGVDTIVINGAAGNEIITATTLGATVNAGAGSDRVVIEAGTRPRRGASI